MLTNSRLHQKTLIISLASATGFIFAALSLGIADNPTGAIFMFAGLSALVLAVVHHWRTPRRFKKMMFLSLAGFPVMVILHNVLEVLAGRSPEWLDPVVTSLSVTAFLLAVLVLPVTFFAGIIGMGLTTFFNHEDSD